MITIQKFLTLSSHGGFLLGGLFFLGKFLFLWFDWFWMCGFVFLVAIGRVVMGCSGFLTAADHCGLGW